MTKRETVKRCIVGGGLIQTDTHGKTTRYGNPYHEHYYKVTYGHFASSPFVVAHGMRTRLFKTRASATDFIRRIITKENPDIVELRAVNEAVITAGMAEDDYGEFFLPRYLVGKPVKEQR